MVLDARRVLWMEQHRTLVAADLHLGYVWAQRRAGQLLPITAPEETVERLAQLAGEYDAKQVVLLGDIVHQAVPAPALRAELQTLARRLDFATVRWIGGNHDRELEPLLQACGLKDVRVEAEAMAGPHLLTHGAAGEPAANRDQGGWVIMGHEHPAIHLHDGVTTSVKCPCFLAGPGILILPAFSTWAAGCNVRGGHFMSALAQNAEFSRAYAILGGRILGVGL